jgi:hypothetical protein
VEVFGEERAQFVVALRSVVEEIFAGGQKFLIPKHLQTSLLSLKTRHLRHVERPESG